MTHILIVDDDTGVLSALQLLLKIEGFSVTAAESPSSAMLALKQKELDLILMDLNYSRDTTSGEEGIELVAAIRKIDDAVPIVIMTGWGSIEVAVSTMQKGANDFIQKPWENDRLITIIQNQIKLALSQKQSHKLQEKNQLLQQQVYAEQCGDLVANSSAMKSIMVMINQVAKTDANILLTGENGTGKSMFARYIHNHSLRKTSDITSVNMGAVTESLFESEMFGHMKGAFTDAKTTRIGRFELAEGGTLFLDEIANTPYSQQIKLLRVLEERQFEKVGANKTQTADVRLITATNSNLAAAVSDAKFRKDLLYRINTIEIEIPPLRQRREDIIPLALSFLKKAAIKNSQPILSLSKDAESVLLQYSWPGNIRELSHVMERAQILCTDKSVGVNDLGLPITPNTPESNPSLVMPDGSVSSTELTTLEDIELQAIEKRLTHFKGNAIKAAKSLGLSRSAFYRRLEKLE